MTNSQNTHTPGPWYGKHSTFTDQGLIISESTGATIAACYTNAADTRLIAAAPDLLAALRSIETRASCAPNDDPEAADRELERIMNTARRAIEKTIYG